MLQRIHDSMARWVIVIVLGLIAFSFIFWGVDFGLTGASTFAAKVNGEDIPLVEFDQELQSRQNQYQQLYRTELTDDVRREMRRAVVEDLVSDTALKQRVEEQGYRASDARVAASIQEIAAFQVNGEFSLDVYRGLLANQGLTPTGFENLQRESLEVRDLQAGIVESTFYTPAEFRRYIELYNQRRELAYALFQPEAYRAGVTVDDAAIVAYYDSNQASYQTAESVDLEYVEIALADVAAGIEVTEEDLLAAYEEERERFATAERRTRHILIEVQDDNEDAARAAAEAAAARVRGGEDFAGVAAEVSADAGTKAQGGDLGWVGRGMLVGPFEDALFAMQVGELSEPVRSDFGYHILRLEEVRAGEQQPFEVVRDDLLAETRTRRAEADFYDRANRLGDAAFDAFDELGSVAMAMDLPLQVATRFPRTGDNALFTNSAAVVQAAFAEEIVDSGRNSALVELADDHVLVLRVTEHHLPATRPLDEVREQIREDLTREQAERLAEEAAQAFLAELAAADDPAALAMAHSGEWRPAAWITRTDADVPTEVLAATFGVPKSAIAEPQREVVALANGAQAVIVVTGVQPGEPTSMTQEERDQRQRQLADQAARAELTGYAGNVRQKAVVRIPDDVLEPPLF
jgi:peptidyl-prolyl cis-trans isomerase D